MKLLCSAATIIACLVLSAAAYAAEDKAVPGASPASEPAGLTGATSEPAASGAARPAAQTGAATAPAPSSRPAGKVVATVGKSEITSGRIDAILARFGDQIPPEQMQAVRAKVLKSLILQELASAYVTRGKVPCSDAELAAEKEKFLAEAAAAGTKGNATLADMGITDKMVNDKVKIDKALNEQVSKEKVAAFMKDNASYFDGTAVAASHILILCEPTAPTAQQKEARDKLQTIAQEIASGKISFEDAAKKYSGCPSSKDGGALGEFTYDRMVPPFSKAAFALKPGQLSDIVRTQFGFHLIKVTNRTEGKARPDADAEKVAEAALKSQVESEVIGLGLDACPIVIEK